MHVVAENFNEAYNKLAKLINENAEYISSPRGMQVKESLGVSFKIKNPRHRCIFNPARKFKPQYVVAEALWYLTGNAYTSWISHYAPFWKGISDDGSTANSAYGARMFRKHGKVAKGRFNQWEWVKGELQRDPNSRRAIIHLKVPDDSIDAKLDVPCTLALQFLIRDERLHMAVNMRSSDLILGIANDIPAFTLFQEVMALELGVDVGEYIHTSNSLHVYERHWSMLEELCDPVNTGTSYELCRSVGPNPNMPGLPDLSALVAIEDQVRNSEDVAGIDEVLSSPSVTGLDDYWKSWVYALASHQAKVLDDNELSRQLIKETFFA